MITRIVTATATATSLKELMQDVDADLFPNGNDTCIGVLIQVPSDAAVTVQYMSEGQTSGITLDASGVEGPPWAEYPDGRVGNTYLKAASGTQEVVIQLLQRGA